MPDLNTRYMNSLNVFITEVEPVFYIHLESLWDYKSGTCWYLVMYCDHVRVYDYRIKGEKLYFRDTIDYGIELTIPIDYEI